MSLAAPLTFTMLQRTRVSKGSSEFSGNASLDGRLSHLLEGLNVTQVLPLEPPDAWARRREDVTNYLHYFSQLVKLFSKERPINCKWYLWGTGMHGEGELALWGQLGEGTGTRPHAKPRSGQKELGISHPELTLGDAQPPAALGKKGLGDAARGDGEV